MRQVCLLLLLASAAVVEAQQQIVDPGFQAIVANPAYPRGGPTVAIDEAHDNFHTRTGQYAPFASLLEHDGYQLISSTRQFEPGSLSGIDVLVIANARNIKALMAGDIARPAFTEAECDVVSEWVRAGGSLLLIADHAPYGNATESLAKRFDVMMGKGWAFDRVGADTITTQLVFTRDNGLLGVHPILRGRTPAETITRIKSFTGQSLSVPAGATILMKLGATAREAATPDDLDAEDAALRSQPGAAASFGTHSTAVGGRAQGIVMPFGKGRLVVLGEAGLLSAQIIRTTDETGQHDMPMGMNVPGFGDRQFALNIVHWLSRLLE